MSQDKQAALVYKEKAKEFFGEFAYDQIIEDKSDEQKSR